MDGGKVIFRFEGDDKDLNKKTSGLNSKFEALGNTLQTAVVGGAMAAAAAMGAMVVSGVKGAADLEQSIGGVETLFTDLNTGMSSSATVIANADKAYKTAGLSANDYMQTVSSFAASLRQSVGGDMDLLAKSADQAVIDMADNANKMGTNIGMIQSAYQGFAKQNYMMLDNLKLGYGGTKTEMERLLKDADKINKKNGKNTKYQISNLNDVYEAIHVVQTELGITGTTAKEADATILGSVSALKGAFQNFISGEGSVDQVLETIKTAGLNIVKKTIEIVPHIFTGLYNAMTTELPKIVEYLNKLVPIIKEKLPGIIDKVMDFFLQYSENQSVMEELLDAGINVVDAILQGIVAALPKIYDKAPQIIEVLIKGIAIGLNALLELGVVLIKNLAKGILKAVPEGAKHIPDVLKAIYEGIKKGISGMYDIGKDLIVGLWNGIKDKKKWLMDQLDGLGSSIKNKIKDKLGIHSPSKVTFSFGNYLDEGLINGMEDMKPEIDKSINKTFDIAPSLYGSAANSFSPSFNPTIINNIEQDPLGQVVNNIKTFSGGAKSDYNVGYGG